MVTSQEQLRTTTLTSEDPSTEAISFLRNEIIPLYHYACILKNPRLLRVCNKQWKALTSAQTLWKLVGRFPHSLTPVQNHSAGEQDSPEAHKAVVALQQTFANDKHFAAQLHKVVVSINADAHLVDRTYALLANSKTTQQYLTALREKPDHFLSSLHQLRPRISTKARNALDSLASTLLLLTRRSGQLVEELCAELEQIIMMRIKRGISLEETQKQMHTLLHTKTVFNHPLLHEFYRTDPVVRRLATFSDEHKYFERLSRVFDQNYQTGDWKDFLHFTSNLEGKKGVLAHIEKHFNDPSLAQWLRESKEKHGQDINFWMPAVQQRLKEISDPSWQHQHVLAPAVARIQAVLRQHYQTTESEAQLLNRFMNELKTCRSLVRKQFKGGFDNLTNAIRRQHKKLQVIVQYEKEVFGSFLVSHFPAIQKASQRFIKSTQQLYLSLPQSVKTAIDIERQWIAVSQRASNTSSETDDILPFLGWYTSAKHTEHLADQVDRFEALEHQAAQELIHLRGKIGEFVEVVGEKVQTNEYIVIPTPNGPLMLNHPQYLPTLTGVNSYGNA